VWVKALLSLYFGLVGISLELFLLAPAEAAIPKYYLVVIDPGHGGHDVGSIGRLGKRTGVKKVDIYEKNLALKLSRRIRKILQSPEITKIAGRKIRVELTRNSDKFISLDDRAKIVKSRRPDLFVSVHFNSEETGQARGFETYVLNNTTPESNDHVERIQSRRSRDESEKKKDLSILLSSLSADAMVGDSKKAALSIQKALAAQTKRDKIDLADRGLRQSLLQVLLDARSPAVLVEGAFLSNSQDLEIAMSAKAQDSLARGIATGTARYLAQIRKK
jgi:N-acetylmuramoyl-L-alanine amidase